MSEPTTSPAAPTLREAAEEAARDAHALTVRAHGSSCEGDFETCPSPYCAHFRAALARADDGLDAAWKEAEAALPEGWDWEDITRLTGDSEGEWSACARNDTGAGRYRWCGVGPTPAAALRALAALLQGEQG